MSSTGMSLDECRTNLSRAPALLSCLEAVAQDYQNDFTYLEIGCCFKEDEALSTYISAKFISEKLNKNGRVISFEMNPEHIEQSKEIVGRFDSELLPIVEWVEGSSLITIPRALSEIDRINFAFIDGGGSPAVNLFEFVTIWSKLADGGIVVIDDCSYLKPNSSYPGRRDFGKAQLILPFLLMVENINFTRSAHQARSGQPDLTNDELIQLMIDHPSGTPFMQELYQNPALHEISQNFADMEFFFSANQLIVGHSKVISRLWKDRDTNRVSF